MDKPNLASPIVNSVHRKYLCSSPFPLLFSYAHSKKASRTCVKCRKVVSTSDEYAEVGGKSYCKTCAPPATQHIYGNDKKAGMHFMYFFLFFCILFQILLFSHFIIFAFYYFRVLFFSFYYFRILLFSRFIIFAFYFSTLLSKAEF
jgi:hypothetical protein